MAIRGNVACYIQTYSGGVINPLDPDEEDIKIEDIAHALSCQCRYSGHIKEFYSVAQHCVLVSDICPEDDKLWGLLHDASEAYLVDVPRPLKRYSSFGVGYMETEVRLMKVICQKFGLAGSEMPETVRKADDLLLRHEANSLLVKLRPEIWKDWDCSPALGLNAIKPWSCHIAEQMFLDAFALLGGKR